MKKNTNVLVIGGGPAGIISAVTAKKYYPDKKVAIMRGTITKGEKFRIATAITI